MAIKCRPTFCIEYWLSNMRLHYHLPATYRAVPSVFEESRNEFSVSEASRGVFSVREDYGHRRFGQRKSHPAWYLLLSVWVYVHL